MKEETNEEEKKNNVKESKTEIEIANRFAMHRASNIEWKFSNEIAFEKSVAR